MRTITFYVGLIPTGSSESNQHLCINELYKCMNLRLKDTSFLLCALTGKEILDDLAQTGLEKIYQVPQTVEATMLASEQDLEKCLKGVLPGQTNLSLLKHCPEACGDLKGSMERQLTALAMEIASEGKFKAVSPLRVFLCSNLVIPLSLVHKQQLHLPPRPGTILSFEFLFEGEYQPPTLVNTMALTPTI